MTILGPYKRLWLSISLALTLLGLASIAIYNIRVGLDFTGGTLLEVSSSGPIDQEAFITELKGLGVTHVTAQKTGENGLLVKASAIEQGTHDRINELLKARSFTEQRFENVGPTVGKDLTQKAIVAVIIASAAIICYIAYSFRNVPKPASSWRFGVTAVIALIHDLFITVGIFALLSHFFGYEIDALFITALLTIMGFSVHDTIVVFDRLRENMSRSAISRPEQFEAVANDSLVQTLNRSLNTSLTVILVLLALAILGGHSIRPFVITLLVGVTVGTYSSIATATPLLVVWQYFVMRRAAAR